MRLAKMRMLAMAAGSGMRPFALLAAMATVPVGCGGAGGVHRDRAIEPRLDSGMLNQPFVCGTTNSLDCTQPVMLMPDGHITNFGPLEYTVSSGKWCDASGFHGSVFSFKGNAP